MTTKVLILKDIESVLGRYEYHDDKSHKFYEAVYDSRADEFCVMWGRVGAFPQINRGLSADQVISKIREKSAKGYRFVGDAVSCHRLGEGFITQVSEHSKREQSYARMSNEEFDFEEELQRL